MYGFTYTCDSHYLKVEKKDDKDAVTVGMNASVT